MAHRPRSLSCHPTSFQTIREVVHVIKAPTRLYMESLIVTLPGTMENKNSRALKMRGNIMKTAARKVGFPGSFNRQPNSARDIDTCQL